MNEKRLFDEAKFYSFVSGDSEYLSDFVDDEIRRNLREFADGIGPELSGQDFDIVLQNALEKRGVEV